MAVLKMPAVLLPRTPPLTPPLPPTAVLPSPVAVFCLPVVRLKSAPAPRPVLLEPVETLWRAPFPSPVLALNLVSSAARTVGESPKQASTSGMRRRASREGDRLIDFFKSRVVIFCFFEVGLLIVLTAIQFRAEPGTNPHEAL